MSRKELEKEMEKVVSDIIFCGTGCLVLQPEGARHLPLKDVPAEKDKEDGDKNE